MNNRLKIQMQKMGFACAKNTNKFFAYIENQGFSSIQTRKVNTRAELTTQQIVGLIILIISFVIILYFIFALNLGETTDKEICHNSVALRA